MSRQSLMAELHCKFTPVYIDMNGKVYIGREIEKILQTEIPNTSIIDTPPTNLCTQRPQFGHARIPFGCNNVNSSTPRSNRSEDAIDFTQTLVNAQSSFRLAVLNFIEMSTNLRFAANTIAKAFLLPFNAAVEGMRGYDLERAITSHLSAATLSTMANYVTAYAISNSPQLAFATRVSIRGRHPLVMLIGWGVAYVAYPLVKDYILDGEPAREDWGTWEDYLWHRDSSGRDWWEREYGR